MRRCFCVALVPVAAGVLASCSSSGSSAAPPSSAPSSRVAAAPVGASIKAGSAKRFPATVGVFTQSKTSSGPSTIYSSGGHLISVSFQSGSNYQALVKNITTKRTKAGSGYCGSSSSPTNLTCYLKAADGVINVSTNGTGVLLPQLVTFANGFTAALGTT